MKIFLTYIIKSMLEKKSRLILILTAIVLSSGLLIGSLEMVEVGRETLIKSQREAQENKDIQIYSDKGNGSFRIKQLKQEGIMNLIPEIMYLVTYGEKDEVKITIYGREVEFINKKVLIEEKSINELKNKGCIISMRVAQDHNLKLGDKIEVEINNKDVELEIVGLANSEGLFYSDTKNSFVMLVSYEFLAEQLNMRGKYNYVIADKTEATIKESVEKFNMANPKFKAEQVYSDHNNYVEQMTMPLYFLLAIIICMSIMIIYSSFKLMITERLTIIGTFLSQGATKGTVKGILYMESILYGIVGGGGGILLGMLITVIVNYVTSPLLEYGIIEKVSFNEEYLLIGFMFAILLAFISAIIPIKQINQLQVKALILKQTKEAKSLRWQKCVLGIILLGSAYGINQLNIQEYYQLSPISYILSIIGVMMVFPMVIIVISSFLFNIIKRRNPILGIALNNVATSKVLIDNIKLMFFAMLVVVTIQSASTSVLSHIREAYEGMCYDLNINLPESKKKADAVIKLIKRNEGVVKSTYQENFAKKAKINGESVYALGVDKDKYLDYNKYLDWDTYGKEYQHFCEEDNHAALITDQIAKVTGLKEGDYFKLEIEEKVVNFKVSGILDGKLYYNNFFVLIKNEAFKSYYHIQVPYTIFCNTQIDAARVKENIEKEVNEKGGRVYTFNEQLEENIKGNEQLFLVFNIISIMAIVISALGILNNISIGFIQRKKSMVVLSSVGMALGQRTGMLIFESILTTLWPALIICCFAPLNMEIVHRLLKLLMQRDIPVTFSLGIMPKVLIMATIIMILATIPIIRQNYKFHIVEELKYE